MGLGRLWEESDLRAGGGEGVVPVCMGALPVGREGGPTKVHAGAYVCVQAEGGRYRSAGSTGLRVGMLRFSLPRVSPVTLELSFPEPQFSSLQKWGC